MKATALVVAELRNGRTVLTDLRSEAPIALREAGRREGSSSGGTQRLSMLGSAAGPVGGDELVMAVRVGAGASLSIEAIAATMVFPATSGAVSRQHIDIAVGPEGHLRWAGQPLLVIAGGHHEQTIRIELGDGARLDFLDEVALGRTNEPPGRLDAHLRVERNGLPLLDQRQRYDPSDPAWLTTAGVGSFRHVRHHLTVGRPADPLDVSVGPARAAARFPLDDDAELTLSLGVDRCSGAD